MPPSFRLSSALPPNIGQEFTLGLGLPVCIRDTVYNVSTLGILWAPGPWEDMTSTWSEKYELDSPRTPCCMCV